MKDYTKAGREPPGQESKPGWLKRATIAVLLVTLFFLPSKWKKMLAAQATTAPFWTGWVLSDKVTWAQATAFFKGPEIAAWWGVHVAPHLIKLKLLAKDLWDVFLTSG